MPRKTVDGIAGLGLELVPSLRATVTTLLCQLNHAAKGLMSPSQSLRRMHRARPTQTESRDRLSYASNRDLRGGKEMATLVIPAAIVPSVWLLVKTSLMIVLQRRSTVVEVGIILWNVLNGTVLGLSFVRCHFTEISTL